LLRVEKLEDRLAPAAGALDLTFGTGGKVTTDFRGTIEQVNAVALQTDGKIVVVGTTDFGGSSTNFAVARYLSDGTPDPGFSGDGRTATDFNGASDEAHGVAIQADGKIVVAGFTLVSGSDIDFALARYNPDGSPDDSFGAHGKVTTDFAGSFDFGFALALQADGKIVVAGRAEDGGTHFALARYNPDGTLDDTFDVDGKVTTDFDDRHSQAFSVAVQADGKIVVAGDAINRGDPSNPGFIIAVARYNTDGSPDSDFDVDGKVTTDFNGFSDVLARSVAIQADGKIVVAGVAAVDGSDVFALARYNSDGSMDSEFDVDGRVFTGFGSGSPAVNSVAIQPAGNRIVVAGYVSFRGVSNFALARYNLDGTLDTSFGTFGTLNTDFRGGNDEATSMAIQADGKIVVAGVADDRDFALARYEGVAPEIAVSLGGVDRFSGTTVDYGSTLQSTPVSKTFTIRNLGNVNLTVSSIAAPAGFHLTTATPFPITLAPGAQTSMTVQLTASTAGVFSGKVSIGANDDNENPFVINVTGTVLAPAHEIQVLRGTTDIPDNTGVVNYGTFLVVGTATRTFTVRNIGNTSLTLGPSISVSAPFFLASSFGSTTLAPGASTTFAVDLTTTSLGTFSSQVSFATNDSDEHPFNFTVTGNVSLTSSGPKIRGESLTRQVDEGGVATLRGHVVDPDPQDELFLSIDWGDDTELETHAVGRAPFAFEHRYLDDAPSGTAADEHQVHFTWFDSGGGSNSKTLPVTVANVAPQVSVGLPVFLRTDEALTRVGTFTDPGLDSWYATVDYGDGRGQQWLALGPDNSFTLDHRFTRPGVYQVRVRVFDDDGGIGTATLNVTVRNAPPRLFLGGPEVVRAGEVMRHAGHFTDPDSKTWRATVDYSDGSGPQPLLIKPGQQLSFEHRYATPGKYHVTVTIFDDDGGLSTDDFLVLVLPAL